MIPSQCHFVFHLINHLLCSDQRLPCAVLVILFGQFTKKKTKTTKNKPKTSRDVKCKEQLTKSKFKAELKRHKTRHFLRRNLPLTWFGLSI